MAIISGGEKVEVNCGQPCGKLRGTRRSPTWSQIYDAFLPDEMWPRLFCFFFGQCQPSDSELIQSIENYKSI